MTRLLPAIRVSLALIMAVVSIILLSDLLGILPDHTAAIIDARKKIAETLAVQYSLAARKNDYDSIESSMKMLVDRNDDVLSAALRNANGIRVVSVGEHAEHWTIGPGDKSTPTQMQVPIYRNAALRQQWGNVELRFAPIDGVHVMGVSVSQTVLLAVFVAVTGFLVFLLLIKNIFRSLDSSSVVPSRVRKALDTLTEGVLLIDNNGRILFSNEVLTGVLGIEESRILGKQVEELGFRGDHSEMPWVKTLKSGINTVGNKVELARSTGCNSLFIVNSSPVLDDKGRQQGVMVTFDDITELEEKNIDLCQMVNKLKQSSEKINQQNEKLRILATRDPLTDCLNRRSLFERFEARCMDAINSSVEFCCLMVDIDHFKRVNDTYGHAAGDEVLRVVSAAVRSVLREDDELFRYGGEEFCILLPDTVMESAARLAERLRAHVEEQSIGHSTDEQYIRVTASVGVSSTSCGAENLQALINTADAALYQSKHNGRNQVTAWQGDVPRGDHWSESRHPGDGTVSATGASGVTAAPQQQDVDRVTGLPNRIHFRSELAQVLLHAQNHDEYLAVLVVDLDMFKRINNIFGYKAGDAVLDIVAKRLEAVLLDADPGSLQGEGVASQKVYSLGGDEFGVLLTGIESQIDVPEVVGRLIEALGVPVPVQGREVFLSCRVGISQFPNDGVDADVLITRAAVALQEAKRIDRNSYQFFHDELVSTVKNDYETEQALHYALKNNEFELYFQPQLDVQTLHVESMEALIRWRHPQSGMIMPADFINAAEASGQIIDIGKWVINAACRQIRSWLDIGFELPVAVNLSPVQFRQKDLIEIINSAVSSARIEPKYLQLEITENIIMENLDSARDTVNKLARLGYKISIDDFGTGYSSLEYLKHLPVDNLKIDRAFIRDVDTDHGDAAIVRAAISMAHSMGMRVVAEGVETEAQLLFLRNLRCDLIQGYLLGMPLHASEAIALVDEARWNLETG